MSVLKCPIEPPSESWSFEKLGQLKLARSSRAWDAGFQPDLLLSYFKSIYYIIIIYYWFPKQHFVTRYSFSGFLGKCYSIVAFSWFPEQMLLKRYDVRGFLRTCWSNIIFLAVS